MRKLKREKKERIEDLPLPRTDKYIEDIALTLAKQIAREEVSRKYAKASSILKLVGTGAFLAASLAIPNLPLILKPFLKDREEYKVWKRFNIPYLKRTLERLEKEKLISIKEDKNFQVVEITKAGKRRILRYALDELSIEKPKIWDGRWRLVSYDVPAQLEHLRKIFREYLHAWGFYPLHESTYLHAYPCVKQVEFLREYLGVGKYVRIFIVSQIENDAPFREFFGV